MNNTNGSDRGWQRKPAVPKFTGSGGKKKSAAGGSSEKQVKAQ